MVAEVALVEAQVALVVEAEEVVRPTVVAAGLPTEAVVDHHTVHQQPTHPQHPHMHPQHRPEVVSAGALAQGLAPLPEVAVVVCDLAHQGVTGGAAQTMGVTGDVAAHATRVLWVTLWSLSGSVQDSLKNIK